jgi:hypothetical protein
LKRRQSWNNTLAVDFGAIVSEFTGKATGSAIWLVLKRLIDARLIASIGVRRSFRTCEHTDLGAGYDDLQQPCFFYGLVGYERPNF